MRSAALIFGAGLAVFGIGGLLWRSASSKTVGLGALPPPATTRESCIECVDKHLGAALVLLGETRDGYPHRLRAIGHLHEAEDESQSWPELHNAIRDARKRFQHEGVLPDFVALEKISLSVAAA